MQLVAWLEDMKIRALEVDERDDLRKNTDEWESALSRVRRAICR